MFWRRRCICDRPLLTMAFVVVSFGGGNRRERPGNERGILGRNAFSLAFSCHDYDDGLWSCLWLLVRFFGSIYAGNICVYLLSLRRDRGGGGQRQNVCPPMGCGGFGWGWPLLFLLLLLLCLLLFPNPQGNLLTTTPPSSPLSYLSPPRLPTTKSPTPSYTHTHTCAHRHTDRHTHTDTHTHPHTHTLTAV